MDTYAFNGNGGAYQPVTDDPIGPGGGFCTGHEICPILPVEN